MAKFYLSSTFEDLKECREAVSNALRQIGHEVIGMENYTARGTAPLEKCLKDVAECDYYIGIFAWRYGYVPEDGNPKKKSITELEYLKAVELRKEPLIFMLSENASWPRKLVDRDERQIEALRQYLSKKHLIDSFDDCAQLTVAVAVAVANLKPPPSLLPGPEPPGPEPPDPLTFWERHPKLIIGAASVVFALMLFIAYKIYRAYWPTVTIVEQPRIRVNDWEAQFTKSEKLDDHWSYPKGAWSTEPGELVNKEKTDEALLVKGQEMGIPSDLNGEVFDDFRAIFKIRFKSGGTRAAWVLRAQPDRAGGYLFELVQAGDDLTLYFWIYEQGRKKGDHPRGKQSIPFKELHEYNSLVIDVVVKGNKFEHIIAYGNDAEPRKPPAGYKVPANFQDDPANVRWLWGTIGFLVTDDTSVMRVEYVSVYPEPKNQ